jgi:hypothetical protein
MPRQLLPVGLVHLVILVSMLLLAGCGEAASLEAEEDQGVGGLTPERSVEKFVADLNEALRDPTLIDDEVSRAWAERLANHFAPSERSDQRAAFRGMLSRFAASLDELEPGQRLLLDISYSNLRVVNREPERALVALNDGVIGLRWISASGDVLRQRSRNLTELLGLQNSGIPTIRVNGRWFLTEG